MDFTKYVSLLESSSLFFSAVSKLDDPFEGSTTVASVKALRQKFGQLTDKEKMETMLAQLQSFRREARDYTYVSCWHMRSHESAAMWKLYSQTDEAIALQSTYRRLVDVLPDDVIIGLVNYIDYDSEIIPTGNLLWPVMHKRQSFEHETEVRALLMLWGHHTPREAGRKIKVDLASLVERVYVSPDSPDWYSDLVARVTERLGWEFQIKKSRLSEEPVV